MSEASRKAECPYCSGPLRPVAMRCPSCDVEIRARFRQTLFQCLDAEEQALLEQYLLADFNIKSLAAKTGMGYTAIRSRLDRLIEHYDRLRTQEDGKRSILDRLERGEITAAEAADRIAKLTEGG